MSYPEHVMQHMEREQLENIARIFGPLSASARALAEVDRIHNGCADVFRDTRNGRMVIVPHSLTPASSTEGICDDR